jgi:hypothetical protein
MNIYLDGIGVFGPGMTDWAAAITVLRGERPFDCAANLPAFNVACLPATERRRAGTSVKLAIDLAAQAIAAAGIDSTLPAAVFASTSGDTHVLTDICAALATEDRLISPMRFHNSVHNAAAGYWTIAQHNREPATAVALHKLTASAGLLEAATQVTTEHTPVLLVIYDIPFPPPLNAAEPILAVFGMSFLLQPEQTARSVARLSIHLVAGNDAHAQMSPALEALRTGVPAALLLPLLAALAEPTPRAQTVVVPYAAPHALAIGITPLAPRAVSL